MISHHDPETRTHYQFKDEQAKERFLSRQKEQFQAKLKQLADSKPYNISVMPKGK